MVDSWWASDLVVVGWEVGVLMVEVGVEAERSTEDCRERRRGERKKNLGQS